MKADEMLAYDQEASKEITDGISKRETMLFFFSVEDYLKPASTWDNFIHPCQKLPG